MRVYIKGGVRDSIDAEISASVEGDYSIDFIELTTAEYLQMYRELIAGDPALACLLDGYGYRGVKITENKTGNPK